MSSSPFVLRLATEPVAAVTLEQIAREGARRALQKAIEDEVAEYIGAHQDHRDEAGHRLVVRNGHKPARTILSGVGPISVSPPRVDVHAVAKDRAESSRLSAFRTEVARAPACRVSGQRRSRRQRRIPDAAAPEVHASEAV